MITLNSFLISNMYILSERFCESIREGDMTELEI